MHKIAIQTHLQFELPYEWTPNLVYFQRQRLVYPRKKMDLKIYSNIKIQSELMLIWIEY